MILPLAYENDASDTIHHQENCSFFLDESCETSLGRPIGVRANIHLGGGRPSFARMDSVGGG